MLSDILMQSLVAYWPYFDISAQYKSLEAPSSTAEPTRASEERNLLFLYSSALSDPSNLGLEWVDPIIYWHDSSTPAKLKEEAEATKDALRTIYKDEYDRLYAPTLPSFSCYSRDLYASFAHSSHSNVLTSVFVPLFANLNTCPNRAPTHIQSGVQANSKRRLFGPCSELEGGHPP